jgi:hypothetical protein
MMSRTADRSNETTDSGPICETFRWRGIRVVSVGAAVAAIAVFGPLILTSGQESSAATPVSVAGVPSLVGSDSQPAPASMPADMPGMDMSGSSQTPTSPASMPADMPGMDMSGSSPTPSTPAVGSGDMPGMDMSGSSGGAAGRRPLAPVLGTFGGGTAAVLLTAGMMRRKDRTAELAKRAARAAGRSGK